MPAGKKAGTDVLQQKSPAEFFADNKNIAGFDNVRISDRLLLLQKRFNMYQLATFLTCIAAGQVPVHYSA